MKESANWPKKVGKVYRVDPLNVEKGIVSSLRVDRKNRKFAVCLCLGRRNIMTTFSTKYGALNEMQRYRNLYKEIKQD